MQQHGQPAAVDEEVVIPVDGVKLEGHLLIPPGAQVVVLFAHGSGSSRFSPRNQFVAAALNDTGFGTLLMDLLSSTEEREDERSGRFRFDIPMLGRRVVAAVDW